MDRYKKEFVVWEAVVIALIIGCVVGGAVIGHYLATVLEASP